MATAFVLSLSILAGLTPFGWLREWWFGHSVALQVFYAVGIVALLLILLQTLLLITGSGDALELAEGEAGFLSFRAITGFLLGFGWMGVIFLENGYSLLVSVAVGSLAGVGLMATVSLAMLALHRMRASGTLNYENAVGTVGTVYLPIPPSQEGPGKVEVHIQGRSVIVPAYTPHHERIGNQQRVRVTAMVDPRTVLVEPLTTAKSDSDSTKDSTPGR